MQAIWPDICSVLQMMVERKTTQYNLESRTFKYSRSVIEYIKKLPKSLTNLEIGKQLVRSAGSVGANYIEANESLGKKDFFRKLFMMINHVQYIAVSTCWDILAVDDDPLVKQPVQLGNLFFI